MLGSPQHTGIIYQRRLKAPEDTPTRILTMRGNTIASVEIRNIALPLDAKEQVNFPGDGERDLVRIVYTRLKAKKERKKERKRRRQAACCF